MSFPGVRCLTAVLGLATACGGRAILDGADSTAGIAGSSSAGGALSAARSASAGAGNAGADATDAGGVVVGGGDAPDAGGGTDSGITAECPLPNSNFGAYSALDGKGCAVVGAFCSAGYETIDCYCVTTGNSPTWRCMMGQGGPPK